MMFPEDMPPMPDRPGVKVRDLGREILRKANTCTWIDFITDNEKKVLPSKIEPRPTEGDGHATLVSKGERKSEGIKVAASNVRVEQDKSQLELLKSLQAQQQTLIEQQRYLHDQIQRQMESQIHMMEPPVEGPDESEEFETKPKAAYTPVSSPSQSQRQSSVEMGVEDAQSEEAQRPKTRRKRGLRRGLAQTYALRDEGSVGSLIWRDDHNDDKTTNSNWSSVSSNYRSLTSIESEEQAMNRIRMRRAPDGSAMRQLLSQSCSDVSSTSSKTTTLLGGSHSGSSAGDDAFIPSDKKLASQE